jgi:hypothetical protein
MPLNVAAVLASQLPSESSMKPFASFGIVAITPVACAAERLDRALTSQMAEIRVSAGFRLFSGAIT